MKKKYTPAKADITLIDVQDVITMSVTSFSEEHEDNGSYVSIFG